MNYENHCRTCLRLIKGSSAALTDEIYEFLAHDLGMQSVPKEHPELRLPQNLCTGCHNRILKFNPFLKKCREVETFFKLKMELLLESKEDEEETQESEEDEYTETVYAESIDWQKEVEEEEQETVTNSIDCDDIVFEDYVEDDDDGVDMEIFQTDTESVLEEFVSEVIDAEEDIQGEHLDAVETLNESNVSTTNANKRTEKKQIDCSVCGKRFFCPAHLRDHENIHKGIKPFCCDICGKCFRQRNTLVTHQTLHFGKPVECAECGKKFARKSQLILHDRMHRDEKPFICDFEDCNSEFRLRTRLLEHQAKHSGYRNFHCDICGHSFFNKKGLKGHMYKIHPKFSYQCDLCLLWFSKPSYIRKHMLAKHKVKIEDVSHLKKPRHVEVENYMAVNS